MTIKFLSAEPAPWTKSVPEVMKRMGCDEARAKFIIDEMAKSILFLSECGTYQVSVALYAPRSAFGGVWPEMVHLSMKRVDKKPFHDWRIVQEIKNALLGPEYEAVELYPAESRLVDSANQYHLWAFTQPGVRFPFGFDERLVQGPNEGISVPGSVQRGFGEEIGE